MPNQKIADVAAEAMHDSSFESKKGYCSRFVRQVVAKAHGSKYSGLFGASAIDTGHNFKRAGLDVNVTHANDLEIGDILFKMVGSGGFGHVGIYVGGSKGVASNSSTRLGRISGAKGYRTLGQWGAWQLVGRIPGDSPAVATSPTMYHLIVGGNKVADMPVLHGQTMCPVRAWANAFGFALDWNEDKHEVLLDGSEVDAPVTLIDDHAFLPIETLVNAAGLSILETDDQTHRIVVGTHV
ncbi:MAG: hypothetical protein ABIY70_04610 [Capsulimonas sp.]|uniref:hypothetical protein n=1 Tax=Capsulimonas sp. TaxID=2494211 RepID=UPI00326662DB